MSLPTVRIALETALAAMSPALGTAWDNADYTPTVGTPYQQAHLMPAEPANPETGGLVREQGILSVRLMYPLGAGPGTAETRAELIRSTFYRGASFTSGGVTTVIERTPEIAPGRAEDDRWVVPVRIRFYAYYSGA